ncbi:unnamed protein product [Adineta steineri]|nr:unnamed protein product [Adineta steineri]
MSDQPQAELSDQSQTELSDQPQTELLRRVCQHAAYIRSLYRNSSWTTYKKKSSKRKAKQTCQSNNQTKKIVRQTSLSIKK